MELLLPLGLIGLVSLAVLILIYILRPNYQQRLVSSTFVWKLSLKYRRNKIPVSKLRNLLILLCQLLLLAALALMMAQPVLPARTGISENEKIAVIDASADMMIASKGETRFERAVNEVRAMAQQTFSQEDGYVTVIVADTQAYFLKSRVDEEGAAELDELLVKLVADNACGYGSADVDGAAALAEDVLAVNSEAEVLYYTAAEYLDEGSFTVVNVSGDDDWNAAVLGVTPVLGDSNTYSFSVDVGCYGIAKQMTVTCELTGVNGNTTVTRMATKTEVFSDVSPEKTLTFTASDFSGGGESIVSFAQMYVYLNEDDSLQRDNTFNVYGGTKPTVRVQYASSHANEFFPSAIRYLRESEKNSFDVRMDQVSASDAKTEGYDLYIFEHSMPSVLPTDGVVILADPDVAPEGSGITVGALHDVSSDSTLSAGPAHPITQYMDPTRVTIARYHTLSEVDDSYEELMYYNGEPVLLARNQPQSKVVVMAFDLNRSNFPVTVDFPIMMHNLFSYYLPATLERTSFEVGEEIVVNARGEDVSVDGPGGRFSLESLPAAVAASLPGDYTVTQTGMSGAPIVDQFFVHIPNAESRLGIAEERLPALQRVDTGRDVNESLILWFAVAALVLLVAEWFLHMRETL